MSSKIESVSGRKTAQEHVKTLGYRFVARLGEGTFSKVCGSAYVLNGLNMTSSLLGLPYRVHKPERSWC